MEKIKLGNCATYINGYAFKPTDWKKSGIPIIRIQDLTKSNSNPNYYDGKLDEKYIIKNGDVLISWSGSLGVYEWNGDIAYLNQHIFKVKFDKKEINKNYFIYLVESKIHEMLKNVHGSTMKHITKSNFDNIDINLHTIDEQEEIAKKITTVKDVINIRKEQLENLERLIKSQFVELFGNISEYQRLEDYSVLITKGASPKWQGINYQNDGTLFVTSENVREGFVDISKPKYLDNKINEILPRSILKRDDILINIVGASIGRAAKYDYDYLANINQAVALVRTQNINNIFLLTYLNSDEAIKMYDDMKKGGARENLSLKNIADLRIPKAPMELQNQFAEFVKLIDKQKFEIQKSLDEMQNLYESLMDQYFG